MSTVIGVPAKPGHGPQIDEDLGFQQRNWRAQRVGWTLLGAVVFAGLAGLLGSGPLSTVHVRGNPGLEVEYERFVRHGAQSRLKMKIAEPASTVHIAISRRYLEALEMTQMLPAPSQVQAAEGFIVYSFASLGRGPTQATFVFQPDELGSHEAQVAVDGGPMLTIRQFTYP